MDLGPQKYKPIVFWVLDLISIWSVQDKACAEKHITSWGYKFREKALELQIFHDTTEAEEPITNEFIQILWRNQIAKISFITVPKLLNLLAGIPKDLLSEAAEDIREYKRAVFYMEEYLRDLRLNKNRKSQFGLNIPE